MVLGRGLGDQHDRAALVAKGAPHCVRQVLPVGVGKQFVAVDKQQEGGRRLPDLGGVEELEEMPRALTGCRRSTASCSVRFSRAVGIFCCNWAAT